ncbi:MAG: ABC transporter permease [Gammaproteobacteria bacterium]|nr:ABC transporter permease [Gammaproteobacteria bacterium]
MNNVINIGLSELAYAFLPVVLVLLILFFWRGEGMAATHAVGRMLLQLVLVGYVLTYIFAAENLFVVMAVLTVMLIAAGWIALRTVEQQRHALLLPALIAIGFASLTILFLVTQLVLGIEPWYAPRYLLPLGGMVFAACMNAVSLAVERVEAELARGRSPDNAQRIAFNAALIPVTNSLFAVGLVSLPGMMTGQILSGVSPLIAARYQIVVMCMLFSASGLAAVIFLYLHARSTRNS